MGRTIVFVSDISNSFLLNTIITCMEKESYDTELVDFDPVKIQIIHKDIDGFFLFVGQGTAVRNYAALMFIVQYCRDKAIKLFLLGDQADIDEACDVIEDDVIWGKFPRPVNAGDVAAVVVKLFEEKIRTDVRKQILLVDDSGTVLHTMKQWLEPTYKVQMVNSAANALVYLAKHRPDLILLDYEMPICDGPQMLGMLRADPNFATIPVMFLTGRGDRESIQAVLALQPQGYLLKTLPKEKIHEALREFFAQQ